MPDTNTPNQNDSILLSIKTALGPSGSYDIFDPTITMFVNGLLNNLNQLGVGVRGFYITGESETWADFIPEDTDVFHQAFLYMYTKTRLYFDPPQSSFHVTNLEKLAAEAEWRLNVQADPGDMP